MTKTKKTPQLNHPFFQRLEQAQERRRKEFVDFLKAVNDL